MEKSPSVHYSILNLSIQSVKNIWPSLCVGDEVWLVNSCHIWYVFPVGNEPHRKDERKLFSCWTLFPVVDLHCYTFSTCLAFSFLSKLELKYLWGHLKLHFLGFFSFSEPTKASNPDSLSWKEANYFTFHAYNILQRPLSYV